MITFREYEINSREYDMELSLRSRILREPLGLELSDADVSLDHRKRHIGAFNSDSLVGSVEIEQLDEFNFHFSQMAVSVSYQGRGIGSNLIKYAEAICASVGAKSIRLKARGYAVGFYESCGYAVCSDVFELVGIPHFLMEKSI